MPRRPQPKSRPAEMTAPYPGSDRGGARRSWQRIRPPPNARTYGRRRRSPRLRPRGLARVSDLARSFDEVLNIRPARRNKRHRVRMLEAIAAALVVTAVAL